MLPCSFYAVCPAKLDNTGRCNSGHRNRQCVVQLKNFGINQKNFAKGLTVYLVHTLHFKENDDFVAGGHDMEVLVQTHNLTKQYRQHKVVSNVNLSVNKGEIYGLIGRNGAGKTTILRLLCGLAKPTEGEISLFGQKSHDMIYTQNRVGILIENPGVYPNMSAKDNIKLKCLAMGISGKGYIAELLADVGLSAADKKKVKHFSVGMKQRLGIALALAGNPELVLLDEPINGLDPQGIAEIREMIIKLNKEKGITFIISSHILGELSKIATSFGIIDKGELKKQILKTALTEDLEEYYLSLTGGISND